MFFAGVGGDVLGGVISDYILKRTVSGPRFAGSPRSRKARLTVVTGGFLCSFLSMLFVFSTRDLTSIVICLAAAFFFAEIVIGPMWAIPMDIAPRYSGTASGIMNTGSALAAILSPVAFGIIADATGDWHLPFAGSLGLLLLGALLAYTMHPERTFEESEGVRTHV